VRASAQVSQTARAVVISSANGGGCQAAPSSSAATSGGGQLSRVVTKAGEVVARRGCSCERRVPRSHAHLDRVIFQGESRAGARRACGGCRSGPGGAAHAGEPLSRVSKRMAAREEACGARACEHRRASVLSYFARMENKTHAVCEYDGELYACLGW
jgi:hypothetical protein